MVPPSRASGRLSRYTHSLFHAHQAWRLIISVGLDAKASVCIACLLNLGRLNGWLSKWGCVQELKSKLAKDADVGPAQKRVVYQLQLLGCTFRRALRKRGKRIIVTLSSASEGLPSAEDERVAAVGVCDLLETADAAMRTIQKVQSLLSCLCDPYQVHGLCGLHSSAVDTAALPTCTQNSQHSVQS